MESSIKCDLCNVYIHKNHFKRHEKSEKHIINFTNNRDKQQTIVSQKKKFNKRIITEFKKHDYIISDVTKNEKYTDERCIEESYLMKRILIVHEKMPSPNTEPYDVILFYKNNHVLVHYKNVEKLIQKIKNDLHIDKSYRECDICMNNRKKFYSCETCFKEACVSCVYKCLRVDDSKGSRLCDCCYNTKKLFLHNGYHGYICCYCREKTFIKKEFFE